MSVTTNPTVNSINSSTTETPMTKTPIAAAAPAASFTQPTTVASPVTPIYGRIAETATTIVNDPLKYGVVIKSQAIDSAANDDTYSVGQLAAVINAEAFGKSYQGVCVALNRSESVVAYGDSAMDIARIVMNSKSATSDLRVDFCEIGSVMEMLNDMGVVYDSSQIGLEQYNGWNATEIEQLLAGIDQNVVIKSEFDRYGLFTLANAALERQKLASDFAPEMPTGFHLPCGVVMDVMVDALCDGTFMFPVTVQIEDVIYPEDVDDELIFICKVIECETDPLMVGTVISPVMEKHVVSVNLAMSSDAYRNDLD
jgi:hypothetical protein